MKKEQLFDAVGEIDDSILDRYHSMDMRLARKHASKRNLVRVIAVAACFAILIGVCVPVSLLIAQLGKQPPVVEPGEITPPTETGSEPTTNREHDTYEENTVTPDTSFEPDTPIESEEDMTAEVPDVDPTAPTKKIQLSSTEQLDRLRDILLSGDEMEMMEYLSVYSGGTCSMQDMIDFLELVETVPYAELVQGKIIELHYYEGIDQDGEPYRTLYLTIDAENDEMVCYSYKLSVEDVSAYLEEVKQALQDQNLLNTSISSADGRLTLHTEIREPLSGSHWDRVTWWGELDGMVVEIEYYLDDRNSVDTQAIIGSIYIDTGVVTPPQPIVPPEPAEPQFAWENTQFGAYLEQPEFHAYVTYDTTSSQLDQYIKDVEVDSENYTDPNVPKEKTVTVEGVEYTLTYYYSTTQDMILQATHYYVGKTQDGKKVEARFDQETDACVMFWQEGGFLDASIYGKAEELSLLTIMQGYLQNKVSDFDAYLSGHNVTYQGRNWSGFTREMVIQYLGYRSCDALYISYNSQTHMIEGFMLAYVGSTRYLDSIPKELLQSITDTFEGLEPQPQKLRYYFNGLVITKDGRLAAQYHIEVRNNLPEYHYSAHDAAELLIYLTEPIK